MKLPEAYLAVAERSLKAAKVLLDESIQESATFYSYHAFESMGGALCESQGVRYHPRGHPQKINLFTTVARKLGIGKGVATVAIIVASMRNGCLYPNLSSGGSFETPETRTSKSAARDILKRVKGIYKIVKKML